MELKLTDEQINIISTALGATDASQIKIKFEILSKHSVHTSNNLAPATDAINATAKLSIECCSCGGGIFSPLCC